MSSLGSHFQEISNQMQEAQTNVLDSIASADADFSSMAKNLEIQTQADIRIGQGSKSMTEVSQQLKRMANQ